MSKAAQNSEFIDYYGLLGVDMTASLPEIRKGFLKQAKANHPDAGGSTEKMLQLNHAYKTLINDSSRAAYNKMYSLHTNRGTDLDLRDDYQTPSSGATPHEYDDFFVDQVYKEFSQKKSKKNRFKDFLRGDSD